MDRIETSRFDTSKLNVEDRFDAWRESIGVCFDVNPYDEATRERYFARVDSFLLDDIVFNHCQLGAQTFRRDAGRIARDGIDHYQFHVFLEGSVEMDCAGRDLRARRGDFVVLDHADIFASRTTDYEILNVFVPRRRLAPLLDAPDSAHGTVFDSRTGAGRILLDYVAALDRAAQGLTLAQAPDAAEALVRLCALALNGANLDPENPPAIADRSLLLQAQLQIKQRLGDASLGPADVARAIGVSRARLYAIFEPCGGVAEYIREMRLRRAFADLVAPSRLHRGIADIAYSLGFSDPAHFSRVFKRRYGLSPSDARQAGTRSLGSLNADEAMRAGDVKYAFWIANIA